MPKKFALLVMALFSIGLYAVPPVLFRIDNVDYALDEIKLSDSDPNLAEAHVRDMKGVRSKIVLPAKVLVDFRSDKNNFQWKFKVPGNLVHLPTKYFPDQKLPVEHVGNIHSLVFEYYTKGTKRPRWLAQVDTFVDREPVRLSLDAFKLEQFDGVHDKIYGTYSDQGYIVPVHPALRRDTYESEFVVLNQKDYDKVEGGLKPGEKVAPRDIPAESLLILDKKTALDALRNDQALRESGPPPKFGIESVSPQPFDRVFETGRRRQGLDFARTAIAALAPNDASPKQLASASPENIDPSQDYWGLQQLFRKLAAACKVWR